MVYKRQLQAIGRRPWTSQFHLESVCTSQLVISHTHTRQLHWPKSWYSLDVLQPAEQAEHGHACSHGMQYELHSAIFAHNGLLPELPLLQCRDKELQRLGLHMINEYGRGGGKEMRQRSNLVACNCDKKRSGLYRPNVKRLLVHHD